MADMSDEAIVEPKLLMTTAMSGRPRVCESDAWVTTAERLATPFALAIGGRLVVPVARLLALYHPLRPALVRCTATGPDVLGSVCAASTISAEDLIVADHDTAKQF